MTGRPALWILLPLIAAVGLIGAGRVAYAQDASPILERMAPETFQGHEGGDINYARFGEGSAFDIALYGRMLTHITNPRFFVFGKMEDTWQEQEVSMPHLNYSFHVLNLDFDRDGLEDLVVGRQYDEVTLYRNKGTASAPSFGTGAQLLGPVEAIYAIDANEDGYEDLLYRFEREDEETGLNVEHHSLALNNRGRGLLSGQPIEALTGRRLRYAADVNGDGHVDLIARGRDRNRILAGDGAGNFTERSSLDRGRMIAFTPFDWDGDGAENLVTVESAQSYRDGDTRLSTFRLYDHDFDADFQATSRQVSALDSLSAFSIFSVEPVEFSGDGRADLLVTEYRTNSPRRVNHFFRVAGEDLQLAARDTSWAVDPLPFTRSPEGDLYRASWKKTSRYDRPSLMLETVRNTGSNEAPAAPSNLQVSVQEGMATLQWTAPSGDETTPGQLRYHVHLKNLDTGAIYDSRQFTPFPQNEDPYFGAQSRTERSFSFLPSGQYEARVRTVDAGRQQGAASEPVRFSITDALAPAAPEELSAQAEDGGIRVRFSMTSLFDSVRVYRSTDPNQESTHVGTVQGNPYEYLDQDVTERQRYYYRLRAFLGGEASALTEAIDAATSTRVPSALSIAENGYELRKIVPYDLNQDGQEELIVNTRSPRNETRTKVVPGAAGGFDIGGAKVLLENERATWGSFFVRDWNGDLNADLIAFSPLEQTLQIWLLDGLDVAEKITIHTGIDGQRGDRLTLPEVADLDVDGRADLIFEAYNTVVIGWNEGKGQTSLDTITTTARNADNVLRLDYDQDGDDDLLADDQVNRAPVVYENGGDRTFERKVVGLPQRTDEAPEAWIYEAYQQVWLSEDIYPDLLIRRTKASEPDSIGTRYPIPIHELYTYDAATETYEKHPLDFGEKADERGGIRPVHFNNDGHVDFVAVFPEGMRIWMNEGNEAFERQRYPLSSERALVNLFNLDGDGDGDADTFFSVGQGETLYFFENEGAVDNEQPTAPTALRATGDAQALTLSWGDSRDDQSLPGHLAYGAMLYSESDTLRLGGINPSSGEPLSRNEVAGMHRNEITLRDVPPGAYTLALTAIDPLGNASGFSEKLSFTVTKTGVDADAPPSANTLSLKAAYPNPFHRRSTIPFTLSEAGLATVTVYNALGRQVRVLKRGTLPPGKHTVTLQADGLAPGVYFYRLETEVGRRTGKVVLNQ